MEGGKTHFLLQLLLKRIKLVLARQTHFNNEWLHHTREDQKIDRPLRMHSKAKINRMREQACFVKDFLHEWFEFTQESQVAIGGCEVALCTHSRTNIQRN